MYMYIHAHMYILKCLHWCRQFETVAEESLHPFPPHIPTAVPPYWTEWYQPTGEYNTEWYQPTDMYNTEWYQPTDMYNTYIYN